MILSEAVPQSQNEANSFLSVNWPDENPDLHWIGIQFGE
jgi:hypothetical protein